VTAPAPTGPRLLAGVQPDRALLLAEHLAVHGPLPASGGEAVIDLAEVCGLRGRGGAGFPVAHKLRTAREASRPGRRPVVVANGSESEPAIGKDRLLLARTPHLVLDGLQLSARAVGATEAHLCVHTGPLAGAVRAALRERRDAVPTRVHEVPDHYVAGEAGALVRGLAGGPALPATRTAPLAQRGLSGRPTVVHNVESLADLAVAARVGPVRYRQQGTEAEPGTRLITVRGAVARPGVVELPLGAALDDALAAAGGTTSRPRAVLIGGYAGAWLDGTVQPALSIAGLRIAGGTLGAGLVLVLPRGACGLATTARLARWLANAGARQCGPCLNGRPAIAGALERLAAGWPGEHVLEQLERWCGLVVGRGACSHPDGAAVLVRSALTTFADDVTAHLRAGCGQPAGWTHAA
jgi:NADH:ubiquinone oxidoreductase subunit F (NADH-binding)